jgi:hypothetical protein
MSDAVIYAEVPGLAFRGSEVLRVVYDGGPACDFRWENRGHAMVCRLPVGHDGPHLPCTHELVADKGLRFLADDELPPGHPDQGRPSTGRPT